jgi:hypothetical protein
MDLIITAGPPMLKEEEDTASAFSAMEEEIASGYRSDTLADPILPCLQPSVELTLLLDDDEPAAFAKYSLSLPGGDVRSGVLDENGFVRIEDLDIPADQVMLQVEVFEDDDDPESVPEFTLQLVPKVPDPETAETLQEDSPEQDYFHPTFDHRVVPPSDPEEAADNDELESAEI